MFVDWYESKLKEFNTNYEIIQYVHGKTKFNKFLPIKFPVFLCWDDKSRKIFYDIDEIKRNYEVG